MQHRLRVDTPIRTHRGRELERLALVDNTREIEGFDREICGFAAAERTHVDRDSPRRSLVGGGDDGRAIRVAVRKQQQAPRTVARNQTRRQADCPADVAAVRVDGLHEHAGFAKLFEQTFDACLTAERHNANAVASRSAVLDQANELERPCAAVRGHRSRQIDDDYDVHTLPANRRERHSRDQR